MASPAPGHLCSLALWFPLHIFGSYMTLRGEGRWQSKKYKVQSLRLLWFFWGSISSGLEVNASLWRPQQAGAVAKFKEQSLPP